MWAHYKRYRKHIKLPAHPRTTPTALRLLFHLYSSHAPNNSACFGKILTLKKCFLKFNAQSKRSSKIRLCAPDYESRVIFNLPARAHAKYTQYIQGLESSPWGSNNKTAILYINKHAGWMAVKLFVHKYSWVASIRQRSRQMRRHPPQRIVVSRRVFIFFDFRTFANSYRVSRARTA